MLLLGSPAGVRDPVTQPRSHDLHLLSAPATVFTVVDMRTQGTPDVI
jgi:hypothetical protein